MSNRSKDNKVRPQFSALSLTPDEITTRYDHALREEERFQRELTRLHKTHNEERSRHDEQMSRKKSRNDKSATSSTSDRPLRRNFSAGSAGSAAWGGLQEGMLKSVGTGGGLKGTLLGGLEGATKNLGGLVEGLSASQIALNLFIQGTEAAAKALYKYTKDTNDHHNIMIQTHSVTRKISSDFITDAMGTARVINDRFGVRLVGDGDSRKLAQALLPQMKDLDPTVTKSFTETGLVGQTLGVSYNEQIVRHMRQQYQSTNRLGDSQLERLEALAKLSQQGNLSLEELVQLQTDTSRTSNQFAYQLYNSFKDSLGEEGASRVAGSLLDTSVALEAMLQSQYSLSSQDSNTVVSTFNEIATMSVGQLGEFARRFVGMDQTDAMRMQQNLLRAYDSEDLEAATKEFMTFIDYAKSTTNAMLGADPGTDVRSLLSMAGLGDQRLTDAMTSGAFRVGEKSLEEDVNWIREYMKSRDDESTSAVDDLAKDFYQNPVDNIKMAINDSVVGMWAKTQTTKLSYKVSQFTSDFISPIFTGRQSDGTSLSRSSYNNYSHLNQPRLRMSPRGGGTTTNNLGIGAGIDGATPGTGPEGVGPFTLTAGYRDPTYYASIGSVHKGIDYGAPSGTPIPATTAGVVTRAGWNSNGFGNLVVVRDDQGYSHYYGHMVDGSMKVRVGDKVEAGQILGGVGTTGKSTGNHLHYQVNNSSGYDVDPSPWVSGLWRGKSTPGTSSSTYSGSTMIQGDAGVDSTPMQTLKYRQSLLGLVSYRDNSALYSSGNFGVGGMLTEAIRSNQPKLDTSELVEALGVLIGAVQQIEGNVGYNTRYNPQLGNRR